MDKKSMIYLKLKEIKDKLSKDKPVPIDTNISKLKFQIDEINQIVNIPTVKQLNELTGSEKVKLIQLYKYIKDINSKINSAPNLSLTLLNMNEILSMTKLLDTIYRDQNKLQLNNFNAPKPTNVLPVIKTQPTTPDKTDIDNTEIDKEIVIIDKKLETIKNKIRELEYDIRQNSKTYDEETKKKKSKELLDLKKEKDELENKHRKLYLNRSSKKGGKKHKK